MARVEGWTVDDVPWESTFWRHWRSLNVAKLQARNDPYRLRRMGLSGRHTSSDDPWLDGWDFQVQPGVVHVRFVNEYRH